jgi:hypothetical protein
MRMVSLVGFEWFVSQTNLPQVDRPGQSEYWSKIEPI